MPLRDHDQGRYVNVDTLLWGDGARCGQECGFYACAKMGWEYRKTVYIYQSDDYMEKKLELTLHLGCAEKAAPKATRTWGISVGSTEGMCDQEISKTTYGYLGGTL